MEVTKPWAVLEGEGRAPSPPGTATRHLPPMLGLHPSEKPWDTGPAAENARQSVCKLGMGWWGPRRGKEAGTWGGSEGSPEEGREAALTLSCSSRLKLRASWSWTSSSGPQGGGWGESV